MGDIEKSFGAAKRCVLLWGTSGEACNMHRACNIIFEIRFSAASYAVFMTRKFFRFSVGS